ncbi:hypothetical protein [Ferruginibacter sp. HRS2-29]|uniref:hypothetical protein n=1 Tax=Ferruginibacter sp. HRS2-29 TaxID=2487334 RepID=UPI0020CDD767|nr:hypothetical protein [Ferruginibacter sp. HRS2-29]MCP9753145.1 hypothetical protein [Ferruginibacter sp. HRS2-29]
MSTTLSKYYLEELQDWRNRIAFYTEEASVLTGQLKQLVPGVAAEMKGHQHAIAASIRAFKSMHEKIRAQEKLLTRGPQLLTEDHLVNDNMEKKQQQLREKMILLEKEYTAARYSCTGSIPGALKKALLQGIPITIDTSCEP